MSTAQPFVDAVSQGTPQLILAAAVVSGVVLLVGIGLLVHELYLEAKRRSASRIWKNL